MKKKDWIIAASAVLFAGTVLIFLFNFDKISAFVLRIFIKDERISFDQAKQFVDQNEEKLFAVLAFAEERENEWHSLPENERFSAMCQAEKESIRLLGNQSFVDSVSFSDLSEGLIVFSCGGYGLSGGVSAYTGFYYTKTNRLTEFDGLSIETSDWKENPDQKGEFVYYWDHGSNYIKVRKIKDCWYYLYEYYS